MKKYYRPNIYIKDIYQIPVLKLKKQGVKALVFDLDNTIAMTTENYPNEQVIKYFKTLEKDFNLFILSNSPKKRVKQFGDKLGIKYYYLALKPNTRKMKKLLKENNLTKEDVFLIGDQYMTDMLLAKKLNIKTILVDKISNKEFKITSINRFLEKRILKKLAEYKILEKGKYYYE